MNKVLKLFFKLFNRRKKRSLAVDFKKYKLNVARDSEDHRDFLKAVPSTPLPNEVDNSQYAEVKDQGRIGSCNAFAGINGLEYLDKIKNKRLATPLSELFLYRMVRMSDYEDTFPADSGATGRNIMSVLKNVGAVPEMLMPYNESRYNDSPKMSDEFMFSIARMWKISRYERCFHPDTIKAAVASGQAVWLGIPVQKAIWTYKDGVLHYDKAQSPVGGHAMWVVGYSDSKKAFKVVNSWGLTWGYAGFGWIAYDYFNNCDWFDAWSFELDADS